jgi:hypothetical protein
LNNQAHCICEAGYSGQHCDSSVCNPSPCQNGGSCGVNAQGQAVCSCVGIWDGPHCTNNKCEEPGAPNCHGHGTCVPDGAGLKCQCDEGWTGDDCNTRAHCAAGQYISGPDCVNCKTCSHGSNQAVRRGTDCDGLGNHDSRVCVPYKIWCGTDYCEERDNGSSDRDKDKSDLLTCANAKNSGGTRYTPYVHDSWREYGQVFANVFRNVCRYQE